ncbi:MAG: PDZ domain-containing protein [Gammaproteobacteria bacterium]|nr:PDZ domain-containing protein [Gammaproteobacteria bacterium]
MHKIILAVSILMLSACTHAPAPDILPSGDGKQAFLGIAYRPVSGSDKLPNIRHGLEVIGVTAGASADKAGLKIGDILIAVDGKRLEDEPIKGLSRFFSNYIRNEKRAGQKIHLQVIRQETRISGSKNEKTLLIKDRDELLAQIEKQSSGETLLLEIENKADTLVFSAVLSERPGAVEPVANAELFPEFENIQDPYAEPARKLIAKYDLKNAYEDLLDRYHKDEYWDDGFRLNLFRYIHRDPLKLPLIADELSLSLENIASRADIPMLIQGAAKLLDQIRVSASSPPSKNTLSSKYSSEKTYPKTHDPAAHILFIRNTVEAALLWRNRAFRDLREEDKTFIRKHIPFSNEYFLDLRENEQTRKNNRKLIRLSHKIDYAALLHSAKLLARLTDLQWLTRFKTALLRTKNKKQILYTEKTAAGPILIGGTGSNRYRTNPAVLIDFGGDDLYLGNAASAGEKRPISLLIDFEGNDQYTATQDHAQGSGILGTGMLIDLAGDDIYTGIRFAQGTALMGIGILADFGGDDRYYGQAYNQGAGFWGYGLLLDRGGNDEYRSDLYAQGVGGPKGIGCLLDMKGDDTYYATGGYISSYGTQGIFGGFSQGFGVGARRYASGGIGILLDAEGTDRFRAGNFSQGGAYFFGLGILKNAGSDDDRYTASRYGQGFSAHSAAGILIDEGGNDYYSGHMGALQGAAWDLGVAALLDKSGNDIYNSSGLFFSQAAAAHNGLAIFIDNGGSDRYYFSKKAKIAGNHYHGGYSFSLFFDKGDELDFYNDSTENNNQMNLQGEFAIMTDGKIKYHPKID